MRTTRPKAGGMDASHAHQGRFLTWYSLSFLVNCEKATGNVSMKFANGPFATVTTPFARLTGDFAGAGGKTVWLALSAVRTFICREA